MKENMKELNMNEEAKVNGGYVDQAGKDPNYPYDGKTPNYPYTNGKEANYPYLNEAEMSAVSGGTGPLDETGPLNETGPLGYPYKDETGPLGYPYKDETGPLGYPYKDETGPLHETGPLGNAVGPVGI